MQWLLALATTAMRLQRSVHREILAISAGDYFRVLEHRDAEGDISTAAIAIRWRCCAAAALSFQETNYS